MLKILVDQQDVGALLRCAEAFIEIEGGRYLSA
jgi:hypothetical protein